MTQFIPMVKAAYERRCQQRTDCPQASYLCNQGIYRGAATNCNRVTDPCRMREASQRIDFTNCNLVGKFGAVSHHLYCAPEIHVYETYIYISSSSNNLINK